MKNHEAASKTFVIFCRDITFAFNNVQQKNRLLRVTTLSNNSFELSFFEMCWRFLIPEIRQCGALLALD